MFPSLWGRLTETEKRSSKSLSQHRCQSSCPLLCCPILAGHKHLRGKETPVARSWRRRSPPSQNANISGRLKYCITARRPA